MESHYKVQQSLDNVCPYCILYLTVYIYQRKIEISLRNVYWKAQHQNTIGHAGFFSKVGVNIQKLTHLACLLGGNSRPSQGEYLVYRSLLSEASSQNGKVKFSTYSQY